MQMSTDTQPTYLFHLNPKLRSGVLAKGLAPMLMMTQFVFVRTLVPLSGSLEHVFSLGGVAYLNKPQKTDSAAFQLAGRK